MMIRLLAAILTCGPALISLPLDTQGVQAVHPSEAEEVPAEAEAAVVAHHLGVLLLEAVEVAAVVALAVEVLAVDLDEVLWVPTMTRSGRGLRPSSSG
jgi:hypothetical protein